MKYIIALFVFLYAAVVIYRNIFLGGMPFWYDPARDLTLAGEMFSKFSFLGQPSGIPGFFYPPYWLWYLFSLLHFTRDPATITFLSITLPYILLFPLGLYLLKNKVSINGIFLILAVFVTRFDNYFTQLWNLNLTSLLLVWILVFYERKKYLFLGFATGLLLAFNFALGIPVILTVLLISKFNLKVLAGNFIIFLPTVLFELKNKFPMTRIILPAIFNKVVNLNGLTKKEIIINLLPGWGLSLLTKKPFFILLVLSISFIFLRNSNPIWSYHFIGFETLFLLMFCYSFNKLFVRRVNLIIVLYLAVKLFLLIKSPDNILNFDNLATKKQMAKIVLEENSKELCGFTAYGRTGFERNYEYEYLLNLLGDNLPKINDTSLNCVYVVFPKVSDNELESYLNTVTEVGKWGTKWKKELPSGLILVFRERHEKI